MRDVMEKFRPIIHPTQIGKFSIERWNVVQATYVPMEEVEFGSFAEAKQYARECSKEYAKEMQEDEEKVQEDDKHEQEKEKREQKEDELEIDEDDENMNEDDNK